MNRILLSFAVLLGAAALPAGAMAATEVVRAGNRTEAFTKAAAMPVHVPLSGKQMSFDGGGKCVAGC